MFFRNNIGVTKHSTRLFVAMYIRFSTCGIVFIPNIGVMHINGLVRSCHIRDDFLCNHGLSLLSDEGPRPGTCRTTWMVPGGCLMFSRDLYSVICESCVPCCIVYFTLFLGLYCQSGDVISLFTQIYNVL